MTQLSINISDDLLQKLNTVAKKSHCSFEDCLTLALQDYVDNYQDFYKADLGSVNQLERSFFLSLGE